MKILVTGDRNYRDYKTVLNAVAEHNPTCVVHGSCRGADIMAERAARDLEINYKGYPAKWKSLGHRGAGIIRNKEMLKDNPDIELVLAFHDNIRQSRGTSDMINRAYKAGLAVKLYEKGNVKVLNPKQLDLF